ncbi:sensor histidine kinase [Sphingorhabdus arenilitoris]|uniref:Sensor histidine kinase n=1 Tax=Sphingorhabdus arenilitoris TaxID=1490041 RepID=A0ABV8RJ94_9SPHN
MLLSPKKRSALVSPKIAFLTIIGFWIFHALIVSLRASVMDFPAQDELAGRRVVVTIAGIALTWLLYLFLRLFDRKPLIVRVAAAFIASIPIALIFAAANYLIFNIYDPVSLFDDANGGPAAEELEDIIAVTPFQQIAEVAITRYFFIIAWALLYLAVGNAREVREAERVASRYAQAAQNAELRSLRYQVNPHFLFNTLNSLSSLIIKGQNDRAEAMIHNLSNFYRNSLSSDPLEDVTLSEEVELQKLYLDIEMVRYPERLRTKIDIEASLADLPVPALILQPLVENAIKYGVSRSNRPVTIEIVAHSHEGNAIIRIEDDGDALEPSDQNHGNGIGLPNVRDRLEARFSKRARIDTFNKPGGGFIATITIALEGRRV